MTRHIDLLSVLYRLWGVLALVAGIAILVLALGALAIVTSAERAALGPDFAAGLTVGVRSSSSRRSRSCGAASTS